MQGSQNMDCDTTADLAIALCHDEACGPHQAFLPQTQEFKVSFRQSLPNSGHQNLAIKFHND